MNIFPAPQIKKAGVPNSTVLETNARPPSTPAPNEARASKITGKPSLIERKGLWQSLHRRHSAERWVCGSCLLGHSRIWINMLLWSKLSRCLLLLLLVLLTLPQPFRFQDLSVLQLCRQPLPSVLGWISRTLEVVHHCTCVRISFPSHKKKYSLLLQDNSQ